MTEQPPAPLIPDEDFYFDELGRMVLTAAYLLKRGFCCHNGCRHCPYGETGPAGPENKTSNSEE